MSNVIQTNKVVSLAYTLRLANGEVVDYSEAGEPLEYLHGASNIIPGLEAELSGLKSGDKKEVVVKPADGYGEHNPELIEVMDIAELPKGMPLQVGMEVDFSDEDENVDTAVVKAISGSQITFDFNHPLAGETLHFSVEVIDVRDATAEEIAHGHPHSLGGEFEDEFDEEYDDDEDYEYDDEDEDFEDEDDFEEEDDDSYRKN